MRGRYRIVDAVCLDVLREVSAALAEERLSFALGGDMGVQALLAWAGLDHLLRRTGDIDLLVPADPARIVRAFDLVAARKRFEVIQNPAAGNARVGPLNVDWIHDSSRLLGLETVWRPSIDQAIHVDVRGLELPVQQLEVLLAAKLTGQRVRPQDELDIAAVLQSGVDLDETRLRALVGATRPERYEVFATIRERIREGS